MKFTYSMLRDFVETPLNAEEIGDLLTMNGLELEEIVEVEGEPVLDVNIMANRGDAASVFGMAREVLAKDPNARPTELFSRLSSRYAMGDKGASEAGKLTNVTVETDDCGRYACRVFEDVKGGESPKWMQDRLTKIGQRPISLLVDLTNYVMIEMGQPLHSFDMDKLAENRIVVRKAKPGETLRTLDGVDHELSTDQMMICDAKGPVAAAGIMGGESSEVDEGTKRCLLESAHFLNTSVRRTRKQLNLNTEASYRFERYVDPEGVVAALNRFADLYAQATGGKPVPGVVEVYNREPQPKPIRVRMSRTSMLLAMAVTTEQAVSYLTKLGFSVEKKSEDELLVTRPSWRPDVVREDDVVEEIGRIHGYEKIPEYLPAGTTTKGGAHGFEAMVDKVRDALLRDGLSQMMSHTLRDKHPLDAEGERVVVRNPVAPEMALLRNSMLPSLADAAARNGAKDLHLFEVGRVHAGAGDNRTEKVSVGIMSMGALDADHWTGGGTTQADFYTVKGLVESAAKAAGRSISLAAPSTPDGRFHPTRHAEVVCGGVAIGVVGQIHPEAAATASLPDTTMLAELNLNGLWDGEAQPPVVRSISRNPAVRRDIAVLVSKSVKYEAIESAVAEACGSVLEKQWLFDVYEGKGIPEGSHSLAIALQLRKLGENFTDEEANQVRDAAVTALEALGAQLR